MIRTLIIFIFTLLPVQKGEDLCVTVSGTIFCQEGKGNIPLGGAILSLISGKDTLHTISDNSGRFSFSLAPTFEVTVLAKYQGFDDFRETYQLFGNHTAIAIKMRQSREQLNAARIESEIPFVRKEADTTIFNMAALEKMEGDRALDLLLQRIRHIMALEMAAIQEISPVWTGGWIKTTVIMVAISGFLMPIPKRGQSQTIP